MFSQICKKKKYPIRTIYHQILSHPSKITTKRKTFSKKTFLKFFVHTKRKTLNPAAMRLIRNDLSPVVQNG